MRDDLKENMKWSLQKLMPFILSLIFILFNYIPSVFSFPNIFRPAVGLICVFYWVLHRPDLFNIFMVFFLGFISDIMSSAPMGADIIAFLTVYVLVSNMFSFFNNKPFIAIWCGFSFIFISAEFIKWLVVSVYYAQFVPMNSLFFTILFTIACYPIIGFINDGARKYLMNDEG